VADWRSGVFKCLTLWRLKVVRVAVFVFLMGCVRLCACRASTFLIVSEGLVFIIQGSGACAFLSVAYYICIYSSTGLRGGYTPGRGCTLCLSMCVRCVAARYGISLELHSMTSRCPVQWASQLAHGWTIG